MTTERLDLLMGWEFGERLIEAGIVGPDVRRLVIDVPTDGLVMLYVERFASKKLLKIIPDLQGIKITTVDAEAVTPLD
jgi:hypothetical protein